MRVEATIGSVLMFCALAVACKAPSPAEGEAKADPNAEAKTDAEPADAEPADAEPAEPADDDDAEPSASEPIPKWTGDDRDPSWYHPGIIPGAKELANTGSDVTGEGSLSRVLRLELPADSTPEGCIDQLRQAVATGTDTEIPAATKLPDGRLQVTGAIEGNYRYTLMCGQVEDKVVAFVGYYLD